MRRMFQSADLVSRSQTLESSLGFAIDLPRVDASDTVSYLVLQTTFINTKEFKARKSLDANSLLTNGRVKDV